MMKRISPWFLAMLTVSLVGFSGVARAVVIVTPHEFIFDISGEFNPGSTINNAYLYVVGTTPFQSQAMLFPVGNISGVQSFTHQLSFFFDPEEFHFTDIGINGDGSSIDYGFSAGAASTVGGHDFGNVFPGYSEETLVNSITNFGSNDVSQQYLNNYMETNKVYDAIIQKQNSANVQTIQNMKLSGATPDGTVSVSITAVPEPGTAAILGTCLSLFGLAGGRWYRRSTLMIPGRERFRPPSG